MRLTEKSKSLEQLENDFWSESMEFPSSVVINCHKYRKIPLKDLTIEQIRLLISQKIGLEYLVEIAFEKLDENILAEGDYFEGDLLEVVSRIPNEYWTENPNNFQKLRQMLESKSVEIKNQIGEKFYCQIKERIDSNLI